MTEWVCEMMDGFERGFEGCGEGVERRLRGL